MDARAPNPGVLTVDARGLSADLATVDRLARLALRARRQGAVVLVQGASGELRELIELAGLGQALQLTPQSREPGC